MTTSLALPAFALRWVLRRLPAPVLSLLDGWSQREARRRAERRRQLAMARR